MFRPFKLDALFLPVSITSVNRLLFSIFAAGNNLKCMASQLMFKRFNIGVLVEAVGGVALDLAGGDRVLVGAIIHRPHHHLVGAKS